MGRLTNCIFTFALSVFLTATLGCNKSEQAPSTSGQTQGTAAPPPTSIDEMETPGDISKSNLQGNFSPYVDQNFPNRVYYGDLHVHTSWSFDSGLLGETLGPEDALRFARGEEVLSTAGNRAKLHRPLDFIAVTEHSEYMGLSDLIKNTDPILLADPWGKKVMEDFKKGGKEGLSAGWAVFDTIARSDEKLKNPAMKRQMWDRYCDIADKYNQPGKFTALMGYEWTSAPGSDNLHRNVIFRDGQDRVKQIVPFSAFDGTDPEKLWSYMADYEKRTGGSVLAIPHNGNLSNGAMFQDRRASGSAFDMGYAEERARREPVVEVTQSKGDSETHPYLSPNDEFAKFERWDLGNLRLTPKKKEMFATEYARSALLLGLQHDAKLGANPFKFGMIGSTDTHNALSTSAEDNYFSKMPEDEPKAGRWKNTVGVSPDKTLAYYSWMVQAAGLAAVWARENTREAVFDAIRRKEVYATTGNRPVVRVFAGWDFTDKEVLRPDFAAQGYKRGVPMGGDLKAAPEGKKPTFMVQAMRDPDGPNLDRIQVMKGWLDAQGKTNERIFDVAVSGNRKIGTDGRCKTPVGSTVNLAEATYDNSIGAPVLTAYWKDPTFNSKERAFYYIRVIEIPSPRWTAYDAKRFGDKMPDYVPMTVTDRAYTSPIWYTPGQ
jgi:hypothetical protein